MESKNIKIRINLDQREFEVDGDSEYIMETFGADLREYIEMIKSTQNNSGQTPESINPDFRPVESPAIRTWQNQQTEQLPSSFGEYFNKFPKNVTIVDKLLISSYYVQNTQESKSFTVKEAADILIDQGVKLSNSTAFNKSNLSTKRVFKLTGKSYKVSDIGIEYIKALLNT